MTQQPKFILTPSSLALIAANLVPLAGVVFWGWSVFDVLIVFWMENFVIGVMNILRMASRLFLCRDFEAIGTIPFFCFHYGIFAFVHLGFVLAFFAPDDVLALTGVTRTASFKDPWQIYDFLMSQRELVLTAAGLFASHMVSYIVNFIGSGEYKNIPVKILMFQPYGRVIALHLLVLLGGFIVTKLGQPMIVLIILVIGKIWFDYQAHIREHAAKDATTIIKD